MESGTCILVVAVMGLLALGPTGTLAAGYEEELFRVETEPRVLGGRDAAVQGYVENRSPMRLGDVRLRVESLDASGRVIGESFGWVIGDVPAGSRGFFVIRVEVPGATYRTRVQSFDAISGPATPSASPPPTR
jgi:hypothetical protein